MALAELHRAGAPEVRVLSVGQDPAELEIWRHFFASVGLELNPQPPATVGEAQAIGLQPETQALALLVDEPTPPEGALCPLLPVHYLSFPPLVVLAKRPASAQQLEAWRRRGALAVLSQANRSLQDELVLWELTRASRWFSGELGEVRLNELLLGLGSERRSVMVTVSCPHSPQLSPLAWDAPVDACGSGLGPTRCSGWTGRIYLQGGSLLHVETPRANGAEGLEQILALERGGFRVCELFIPPLKPNCGRAVSSLLAPPREPVEGAKADELPRGAEPASTVPSGRSQRMGILDTVLASSPGLLVAARADHGGNVLEAAGGGEVEGLCATVAMAGPSLANLAASLGMGEVRDWSFTFEQGSLFVHQHQDLLVALGAPTRNPEVLLKKIAAAAGGQS